MACGVGPRTTVVERERTGPRSGRCAARRARVPCAAAAGMLEKFGSQHGSQVLTFWKLLALVSQFEGLNTGTAGAALRATPTLCTNIFQRFRRDARLDPHRDQRTHR